MDTIRIAVVGLGLRGRNNWTRLLQHVDGYRIVAICDPLTALHDLALENIEYDRDVKTYSRYEDVLADPGIDAVGLTVRCIEQGALAAQALAAGKHVHSEVPAAHRMEDCWQIVAAQERSGLVYQLAEQLRYAGYVDAWRELVADGKLGEVTYCEGQYLHHYNRPSFCNPQTGLTSGAPQPGSKPSWFYHMPPIHYLPHDLGPMLKVIDDRVVEVVGMSSPAPSRADPNLAAPDLQVALMKTAKGAVMRMMVSFAQPHPEGDWHWHQIIGTRGTVEWRRSVDDKPRLWLVGNDGDKAEVDDWGYSRPDAPAEAIGSGHHDMDYYVHAAFRDAVLGVRQQEFDVYKAMDTAAPAILAADSIAQGSKPLPVPDFAPSIVRPHGTLPDEAATA